MNERTETDEQVVQRPSKGVEGGVQGEEIVQKLVFISRRNVTVLVQPLIL